MVAVFGSYRGSGGSGSHVFDRVSIRIYSTYHCCVFGECCVQDCTLGNVSISCWQVVNNQPAKACNFVAKFGVRI